MSRELVIFGAGGLAREIAWLAEECAADHWTIAGFVEKDGADKIGSTISGYPVMDLAQAKVRHASALTVAAVGSPGLREKIVAEATAAGFGFATLIHPSLARSRSVVMGEGTAIFPGSSLTVDIRLGRHVQINPGCSVAHDALVGDFSTLSPGVRVSGFVHIGARVAIGTGAVIINGTAERPLAIGEGAVIGAGSVVLEDVAPGMTVAGVPARPLKS
jgi:sugar O-acyltransferase (sialic acid O-acetyltransferase NeuD family)